MVKVEPTISVQRLGSGSDQVSCDTIMELAANTPDMPIGLSPPPDHDQSHLFYHDDPTGLNILGGDHMGVGDDGLLNMGHLSDPFLSHALDHPLLHTHDHLDKGK